MFVKYDCMHHPSHMFGAGMITSSVRSSTTEAHLNFLAQDGARLLRSFEIVRNGSIVYFVFMSAVSSLDLLRVPDRLKKCSFRFRCVRVI